jgi:uncharacterized membrane protein
MSDEIGNTPIEPIVPEPAGTVPEQPWTTTQTGYTQVPPPPPAYGQVPPGYVPAPAGAGLSDSAAGAIAYITFIPAIVFLLIEPYKSKPFVKFHCIQQLGLTVVGFLLHFLLIVPLLGLIIWVVGWLTLVVVWILCVLKASQGGAFKLPVIGKFAAEQSGWMI